MGIKGLTTFINNRSYLYLENYELHDSYVVLDGNSIICQLYHCHSACYDCFGGDYDKYAVVIRNFFKSLFDCNIVPLLIFDGGYEKRKLKTVFIRLKSKLQNAKELCSATEGQCSLFPLLVWNLFVDIALQMGVKCVRSDFEADNEVAAVARNLQCPLISYDSDFYIFDVLYIPFNTVELKPKTNNNNNSMKYIACRIFRIEKFLRSFQGFDRINLPVLAILLGNDYVKKRTFSMFYRNLKLQKAKNMNDQQRTIKTVINWLQHETPESAIDKILARFRSYKRNKLTAKIQSGIDGYNCLNCDLYAYLQVEPVQKSGIEITMPDVERINDEVDSEGDDEFDDESDEECDEEKRFNVPKYFVDNFRTCLYPSCFMDLLSLNQYYCIQQNEDFSQEHSHSITLDIVRAIHKILTYGDRKRFVYVARNEFGHVKKYVIKTSNKKLPNLNEIEFINRESAEKIVLNILNIENTNFLNAFPDSWHLYVIAMKYWIKSSKSKIGFSNIYALIMCAILLNQSDNTIESNQLPEEMNGMAFDELTTDTINVLQSINKIPAKESTLCRKNLNSYFKMDQTTKDRRRTFNRIIIHEFAQFQSCLLHIKYLNSLFNLPFSNVVVSNFYNGTFLYYMTLNLKKRKSLENYVKLLLGSTPTILNSVELIISEITKNFPEIELVSKGKPKKKKKFDDLESIMKAFNISDMVEEIQNPLNEIEPTKVVKKKKKKNKKRNNQVEENGIVENVAVSNVNN